MRKQASNVFELTKGFTTEPTDNAMKTALEMAHYVLVLTSDLDQNNNFPCGDLIKHNYSINKIGRCIPCDKK